MKPHKYKDYRHQSTPGGLYLEFALEYKEKQNKNGKFPFDYKLALRFYKANFPPYISPSKKAFEKYKPGGLFPKFYGNLFLKWACLKPSCKGCKILMVVQILCLWQELYQHRKKKHKTVECTIYSGLCLIQMLLCTLHSADVRVELIKAAALCMTTSCPDLCLFFYSSQNCLNFCMRPLIE